MSVYLGLLGCSCSFHGNIRCQTLHPSSSNDLTNVSRVSEYIQSCLLPSDQCFFLVYTQISPRLDSYLPRIMAPSDYPKQQYFNLTWPSEYVAQVEIDRPKKLNSFTEPMFHSLGALFRQLSTDSNVRVIVLTAAGERAFSAGLDVQSASEGGPLAASGDADPARKASKLRRHILELQREVSAIEECEKPVIAALHGISYGLAIDMTTCCDVRLCSKDTRFAVKEVDIGLAADVGTLTRLPKTNVSMSWIKDVCLTARDFYAEEALKVGFVSGVFESKEATLARAHEIAKLIATKSPVAVQATKNVVNFSRDHSVADGKFLRQSCEELLLTCPRTQSHCCREHGYAPNPRCTGCNAGRDQEDEANLCEVVSK